MKQEAHGFTFESDVQASELKELEKRLTYLYINEHRGRDDYPYYEISNVSMVTKKITPTFNWLDAKVSEQRNGFSRY